MKTAVPAGPGANRAPLLIVGIGASIGGLDSVKGLLTHMPEGQGLAFVLVLHMEGGEENPALKALAGEVSFAVVEATEDMPVLAERIHVIPADKFLNISGGKLTLHEPVHCEGLRMPIDHFFCSLAADQQYRACAILLSGEGADGTMGLSEVKAAGGKTLVEEPAGAAPAAMPAYAVQAGVADITAPAEEMGEIVGKLADAAAVRETGERPALDAAMSPILEILRAEVGHDFRCYKPSTLVRRIRRRMALAKVASYAEYAAYLGEHSDEAALLRKDLLIGVTDFFRQPLSWETLDENVIASLVADAPLGSAIRVWAPGCSTGKEAYSLAMLLTERVEQSGKQVDIQIFATDTDLGALATARSGVYSEEEVVEAITPQRLQRFFTVKDGRYQVSKAIRKLVVFAPQNITANPPFSRLDLISCRNLMIYLDQDVQKKIIALFHFALKDGGFLFLGTAETVGDRQDLFEAVSKKWRIYRRIGVGRRVGLEIPLHPPAELGALGKPPAAAPARGMSLAATAQQVLVERYAPACVMIDRKHQVLYVHGAVEQYLTYPTGELTREVVDMAREGLKGRLRGAITRCAETNRPISFTARVRRGQKSVPIRSTITPLRYPKEADGLLLIAFEDYRVTRGKAHEGMAVSDAQQLEDELKITREELQSTIEQLESSNDELKASNEEVTAANEELQSANEELETSKEELQSLNEELNTVNTRLQEKVDELEGTSNDLLNFLASTNIATVFLDREFKVRRYTPAITRLLSLIPSDVGRPMADVSRRFTDEALLEDARRVLAELSPVAKEVKADDGRWYMRRVTPYRTQDDRIEGVVITFVDIAELKETELALRASEERFRSVVEQAAIGIEQMDLGGRILGTNPMMTRILGYSREELQQKTFEEITHPEDLPRERELVTDLLEGRSPAYTCEKRYLRKDGSPVWVRITSSLTHEAPGRPRMRIAMVEDVSERKQAEQALREAHERAAWLARFPEENPIPVVRVSADGRVLYRNPPAANLAGWQCGLGEPLPQVMLHMIGRAIAQNIDIHEDMKLGDRDYSVTVVPFPAECYANVYGTDITERARAAEAINASEKRAQDQAARVTRLTSLYEVLSRVNEAIVRIRDAQRLYEEVCGIVAEKGGFPLAWVGKIEGNDVTPAAACGPAADYVKSIHVQVEGEFGRGPTGTCAREARPVINDDFEVNPDTAPWRKAALEYGFRASAAFPLQREGKVVGALTLYAPQPGAFDAEQVALLEALAADVSYALDSMQLEERRQRAAQALAESERRYRGLFENMRDGFAHCRMIYDEQGRPADFVYLDVNEAFGQLTGLTDVVGKRLSELLPGAHEMHPELLETYGRVAQTGAPERFEIEFKPLAMWLSIAVYSPQPSHFVAVFDDITQRKQSEHALRESEARLRRFYESGLVGVMYWNMKGEITDANDKFLEMVGHDRDDLKAGRIDWVNMTPPEFRHVDEESVQELRATGVNQMPFEKEYVRKDGSRVPVIVAGTMLDEARFNGVAFVLDITERKRVEEALRESEERYRSLFNTMDEGFCIIEMIFDAEGEPADYRFLEVNAAFERQTGLHDAEGKLMRELAPAHEAHWFEIYGKIALTGEPLRFVNEARALNRWYDVYAYRVGKPENRQVAILFSDITGFKRAEEALRLSEEKFALAFANNPAAIALTRLVDGVFLEVNDTWVALNGYSREEIAATPAGKLDIWPTAEARDRFIQELREKHSLRGWEERFRKKSGETFMAQLSAQIMTMRGEQLVLSTLVDITDRKEAEEALRQSVEELRVANEELERFNSAMVGRELRMIELKKEINALCAQAGQQPRYPLDSGEEPP